MSRAEEQGERKTKEQQTEGNRGWREQPQGGKCREKDGEKGKIERWLWFNEETMILGASRGDGLIFDLSDPLVRVTGLSSYGGLR